MGGGMKQNLLPLSSREMASAEKLNQEEKATASGAGAKQKKVMRPVKYVKGALDNNVLVTKLKQQRGGKGTTSMEFTSFLFVEEQHPVLPVGSVVTDVAPTSDGTGSVA